MSYEKRVRVGDGAGETTGKLFDGNVCGAFQILSGRPVGELTRFMESFGSMGTC